MRTGANTAGIAHDARTARATSVRGAPSRPNATRRPLSRSTATAQNGRSGQPAGCTVSISSPMVRVEMIPSPSRPAKNRSSDVSQGGSRARSTQLGLDRNGRGITPVGR